MTQEEFNAWIEAQGGPGAVQFANENRTIPNPEKQGTLGEANTKIPATITVNTLTWVNPTTGAKLSLSPKGPGQYDVVEQVGAKPATATASTGPARTADAEAQAANDLREKQWNQANGGLFETHAARKEREAKEAAAADAKTKAAQAGGSIVERPDGLYIVRPDGSTVKTNLPGKPQPSSHTTVKGDDGATYVVTVDADGNVSSQVAIPAQSPGAPAPSSATDWRPDLSQPDLGMFDRRKAVAGMLESGVFGDPASKQAQDKALELLKGDFELAKTTATNVGNIQTGEGVIYGGQIRQREGDQTQTNARLKASQDTITSTVKDMMADASKAKTGAAVAGAILETLNNARLFAEQWGGLKDSPTIQPGPNLGRTGPLFQPPGPVPRDVTEPPAMAPVVQPGAPVTMPPGTGLESGGAVGFGAAPDPNAPSPPPVPTAPFTPPPTGVPTSAPSPASSLTDRAMWAQQLFGAGGATSPASSPPPVAAAGPDLAAQAAQAQALVGQRPPVTGGTLAWAKSLGFPEDVLQAFMAIEDGPQVAA